MTTAAFLTLAPGASLPLAVWTDGLEVIAYHTEANLPEAYAGLPRWRFTVPVTQVPRTGLNGTNYPVLDRAFRPLWEGCRITARFGRVAEGASDAARYQGTDQWSCTRILAASPHRAYRADPRIGLAVLPPSRDQTIGQSTFERDGLHPGAIRLFGTVGSHDLGFDDRFVALTDDPREACLRSRRPSSRARHAA